VSTVCTALDAVLAFMSMTPTCSHFQEVANDPAGAPRSSVIVNETSNLVNDLNHIVFFITITQDSEGKGGTRGAVGHADTRVQRPVVRGSGDRSAVMCPRSAIIASRAPLLTSSGREASLPLLSYVNTSNFRSGGAMTKFPWDEPTFMSRRDSYTEVLRFLLLGGRGLGNRARLRLFSLSFVAIIALVGWWTYQRTAVTDVSYSDITSHLARERMTSWKIDDGKIIVSTASGNWRAPIPSERVSELWQALLLSGVPVTSQRSSWLYLGATLTVALMLLGTILFIGWREFNSSSRTLTFGKSRARLLSGVAKKITFKDLVG
jgi:hypothetical protein